MEKILYHTNNARAFVAAKGARPLWKVLEESTHLAPSHSISVQLVRSLAVSAIALFFDFGSLVFLKEVVGMHYLVAAAFAFIVGVLVNYVLSVTWVFANRKLASRHMELAVFIAICAVGLALNLVIIAFLVQYVKFDYRIAKVASALLVFFWSYSCRKKLLY